MPQPSQRLSSAYTTFLADTWSLCQTSSESSWPAGPTVPSQPQEFLASSHSSRPANCHQNSESQRLFYKKLKSPPCMLQLLHQLLPGANCHKISGVVTTILQKKQNRGPHLASCSCCASSSTCEDLDSRSHRARCSSSAGWATPAAALPLRSCCSAAAPS
jgi:hypothetical protein